MACLHQLRSRRSANVVASDAFRRTALAYPRPMRAPTNTCPVRMPSSRSGFALNLSESTAKENAVVGTREVEGQGGAFRVGKEVRGVDIGVREAKVKVAFVACGQARPITKAVGVAMKADLI